MNIIFQFIMIMGVEKYYIKNNFIALDFVEQSKNYNIRRLDELDLLYKVDIKK